MFANIVNMLKFCVFLTTPVVLIILVGNFQGVRLQCSTAQCRRVGTVEVHFDLHRVIGWICGIYITFKHMKMDIPCFGSSNNMSVEE